MKKQNLLKTLILVMTVLIGTVKAFGYAEVEQAVTLSVQPSVAIEKTISVESGTINAVTGAHSGLSASFSIQTNGTDDDYDFIVGSRINTIDGEVNGYGPNGCLIFANTASLPTTTAVANLKAGNKDNPNVIAYPITMEITDPMSVNFGTHATYGECYLVKVNTGTEGILTQTVGQSPVVNTYALGQDESGTYKSTVFFTAVSK